MNFEEPFTHFFPILILYPVVLPEEIQFQNFNTYIINEVLIQMFFGVFFPITE